MPGRRQSAISRAGRDRSGSAWLLVLVAIVAALGILFLVAMGTALRYFERAALAQSQLAAVSQIEAILLDPAGNRLALPDLLARYARSIAREEALTRPEAMGAQAEEVRDADRLAAMARLPRSADPVALRGLVAKIADRERGEARDLAEAMGGLRLRASVLAALLTVGATALAGVGGVALLRANRGLGREVTARTRELTASNARLVAVDRSRRLFFAKASHELRTPVTVMRGEAEVALAGADPAELRDALDRVVVQTGLLGRRIEELLGLARAEDGQLALAAERFDAADVVRSAARSAAPHARTADISLAVEATGPLPVVGDARWLEQAVVAILDNAVKFSLPGGSVLLRADRAGTGIRIAVEDEGIGVTADALPRIFDAYYQADAGRSHGGSGLGLALARWVVERHRGTIRAEGRAPRGCAITLLLPPAP